MHCSTFPHFQSPSSRVVGNGYVNSRIKGVSRPAHFSACGCCPVSFSGCGDLFLFFKFFLPLPLFRSAFFDGLRVARRRLRGRSTFRSFGNFFASSNCRGQQEDSDRRRFRNCVYVLCRGGLGVSCAKIIMDLQLTPSDETSHGLVDMANSGTYVPFTNSEKDVLTKYFPPSKFVVSAKTWRKTCLTRHAKKSGTIP